VIKNWIAHRICEPNLGLELWQETKLRNYKEFVEMSFFKIFTKILWKLWNRELIGDALRQL